MDVRRALLLRAGQSPLEPHLNAVIDGDAARKGATPGLGWAAAKRAPPTTWTETGRTPVLWESSRSREGTRGPGAAEELHSTQLDAPRIGHRFSEIAGSCNR